MNVAPSWIFDGSPIPDPFGYGERAMRFMRKLQHPKSTHPTQAFQLDEWQERIIRRVYGDVHPDGVRKIRTVYLRVARGNRKTSLVAGLVCLHLFGPEQVTGGRGIAAAVDQAQARLTWEEASGLVEMSKTLRETIVKREAPVFSLRNPKSKSAFEAVSSDGKSKHGKTPTFVVTDEIHAWGHSRELWAALKTGLSKVPNSLHWITTTAGAGQDGIAFAQEVYARDVALGNIKDESFLPIIFEIEEDDDWKSEAAWHKANPGLRYGYPDIAGLRSMVLQAKRDPAARVEFEQYHCNRWADGVASTWLDMAVYDEGAEPIDDDALLGEPAWIGVDYGAVNDLSAIVAAFPVDDRFIVKCWGLAPEDGLRKKADSDQAAYLHWRDEGHLIVSPGHIVDRRDLAAKLRELCKLYDVREIAFDPYKLRETMAELAEEGLPAVEFKQNWEMLGTAILKMQETILAGKLCHGGHPILRAHFAAVVTTPDRNGNSYFHKGRSRSRIDAAVAATMAVARAAEGDSGRSIYEGDDRPDGFLMLEGGF